MLGQPHASRRQDSWRVACQTERPPGLRCHARLHVCSGNGHDTVADFLAGGTEDRVEVSGYAGYTELRQVGADMWVVFTETDMLALLGVQASDLGQNDFVFT